MPVYVMLDGTANSLDDVALCLIEAKLVRCTRPVRLFGRLLPFFAWDGEPSSATWPKNLTHPASSNSLEDGRRSMAVSVAHSLQVLGHSSQYDYDSNSSKRGTGLH